ncbi:MAG: hypothetical protein PSV46_18290 [Reyranella sp.]|nr:hypothetical protein [Reyranella sp.]
MNRRAFVFAPLAVSIFVGSARAASDLKVIYIGGEDCPPCHRWANTYKAKWLASPEFRQVAWIEIDSPRFREAYQARYWPGDLKPILDQIPRATGAPRFLIVDGGRIVSNQFGSTRWEATMTDLKILLA